jgi:hypothetical protein
LKSKNRLQKNQDVGSVGSETLPPGNVQSHLEANNDGSPLEASRETSNPGDYESHGENIDTIGVLMGYS